MKSIIIFIIISFISFKIYSQDILPYTNIDVFNRINEKRIELDITPLKWNEKLAESAKKKTLDMFDRQYFAHYDPDSIHWSVFLLEVNYHARGGENCARGLWSLNNLIEGFYNSEPHRLTILNHRFVDTGVYVKKGMYKNRNTIIVVQHFGAGEKP